MAELNLDKIAKLVREHGVPAYVEHTGGGVMVIFAGVPVDTPSGDPRYPVCAGPGVFGSDDSDSMGQSDDFSIGKDDVCGQYPGGEQVQAQEAGLLTDEAVAEFIAERVKFPNAKLAAAQEGSAEAFAALDTWLTNGGWLPDAWQEKREEV